MCVVCMHLFLIEHIGLLPQINEERERDSERHFKYRQLVFIKRARSGFQFITGKAVNLNNFRTCSIP